MGDWTLRDLATHGVQHSPHGGMPSSGNGDTSCFTLYALLAIGAPFLLPEHKETMVEDEPKICR